MLTIERKNATKRAAAELARLTTANQLPDEFKPGTPIVVALSEELYSDVLARVTAYRPPVVLAVHFAQTDRLELITLAPDSTPGVSKDESVVRAHRSTTVGMLFDGASRISTPGQWDEVLTAHKLVPTS